MSEIPASPKKLKLLNPFDGKFKISSPFGLREINGKQEFHKGIDFAVPPGTPVRAFADGHIYKIGFEASKEMFPDDYEHRGLGLRIWQLFEYEGEKIFGWYGHLSKIDVFEGSKILKGEIIGLSGNTGRTTGPHCHIQFRKFDGSEMYDAEFYV